MFTNLNFSETYEWTYFDFFTEICKKTQVCVGSLCAACAWIVSKQMKP